jgi:hypothetical protein
MGRAFLVNLMPHLCSHVRAISLMKLSWILCITLALSTIAAADDVDKGLELLELNQYADATSHFRSAINDHSLDKPRRQRALRYLVAILTYDRSSQSLAEVSRYAELNPQHNFIQSRLAYLQYMNNELTTSLETARAILPRIGGNEKLNLKFALQPLAFGSYAQGNYRDAADYFERLMKVTDNLYYAHLMKLSSYYSGESIKVMVDEDQPLDIDALLVHISKGMSYAEATKKSDVLDYDPETDSAALLLAAGEYARYKQQYQEAYRLLTQAEQHATENLALLLPVIKAGLEKIPKTVQQEVAASKLSIQQTSLPGEAGKAGFAARLIDAEQAAKVDPDNGRKWLEYAILLLSLADVEEAQYTAEAAAEIAAVCSLELEFSANMVRLQAMVNRLDFAAAARLVRKMVQADGIVINQIDILNSYVAIHALGGELEAGKAQLQWVLTRDASYYGAHVALIELLKVEAEQHPHLREDISKQIANHRTLLAEIIKKFSQRLEPQMRAYIKSLMGGAA